MDNGYLLESCDPSSDVAEEESDTSGTRIETAEYLLTEMPDVFACGICKKSYASKNHLNRHMKIHSDAEHHCTECNKSFIWKHSAKLHMRTHTKYRPYCCEECGKTFTDKSWYNSHKLTHTGERKHLCEVCGKLFLTAGQLRKHQDTTHDFARECESCSVKFSSKAEWEEHMKNNESHLPFPCPHCSKRFKNSHACYGHVRYFHLGIRSTTMGKVHACDPCGKIYRAPSILKRHIAVHHMKPSERPRYDCPKCGKSFLTQQSIVEHSCVDRFNCWVCRKKFKSRIEMELHKSKHTFEEINKFACEKCERRFKKPGILKRHKCLGKKKEKLVVQVLKPKRKPKRMYCNKCMITMPTVYFAKHLCIPPSSKKPAIEKECVSLANSTDASISPNTPVKKESSGKELSPFPIAEIKQDWSANQQSNQEMTFIYKFDDEGFISVICP